MSPRRLDPPTVQRRLVELRRLLGRLEEVTPVAAEQLDDDWQRRAVVERLFQQIVEQAVAINSHVAAAATGVPPDEYRASFPAAAAAGALPSELAERLAPAAGLRNVLTHGYLETDLELLAAAVNAARGDFGSYVTAIAQWLARNESTAG